MFDDVRVPAKYREGEEGKGFYLIMGSLDWFRIIVALGGLARAQASLEEAIQWSEQRHAFSKPILNFQGVSFLLAEHYTQVEAARLLCYRALSLKDQGQQHTLESSMAKWFSVEVSLETIRDCMVILGHPAYSTENPISTRLRDIIGYQIGDGTPQIHKLIISRLLLGR
jgi:cyclohexanecarboxyl-CoA dehydrogenase